MIKSDAVQTSLRVLARVLVVVCVAVLTLQATARRTVLTAGYYQQVLDGQRAYERVYDEVLVDPASSAVTHDLLGRLPVPEQAVLANLKLVLPPTTLRQLADEQIDAVVRYLRGDTDTLRLDVNLAPVLTNLSVLAQDYLGDLVAALQQSKPPDFAAFLRTMAAALAELSQGIRPPSLPVLPLSGKHLEVARRALLAVVPVDSRAAVRPSVTAALADSDIATALATVAPYAFSGNVSAAYRDLVALAGDSRWNALAVLERADVHLGAVKTARSFTSTLLGPVRLLAALLGLGALAYLWRTSRSPVPCRLIAMGALLASGAALSFAAMLIVRWQVGRLVPAPPGYWPRSLRSLLTDLQHAAAARLFGIGALLSAVPLFAGVLLAGIAVIWRRRPVADPVWRRVRLQPTIAAGSAAVICGTVLGLAFLPAAATPERCLGSVRMCSLRYDQVTFLATHNAMSTTAARFIGPVQDPDIVSQLDEGARALLVDTTTWEEPNAVAARLARSDWPEKLKVQLPQLINMANPAKPGLWLCHAVCRAGATPLVPTLVRLRDWLDTNSDQIVTLIVQDAITPDQTIAAFAQAGLDRLIFEPPADPSAPWPTLGEMVHSDHRLVVFAQRADGPATWYRNFYKYAMETPFAARSPHDLSCRPSRGGEGKRLFLLNNFVTVSGGSRVDAAIVNDKQRLRRRVELCEKQRKHAVNFIAVDYATIGDALGVVDALNTERLAHADSV